MEIRIKETGNVVMEQEFRAMFPNTGFPARLTAEIINEFGGDVVLEGPQAQPTRYQVAFRDGVEEIDGQWFTKYSVAEMSDEAKAAVDARAATEHQRQRASEYPPVSDYLDGIVKGDQAQMQAYIDACLAVKAKHPKPE